MKKADLEKIMKPKRLHFWEGHNGPLAEIEGSMCQFFIGAALEEIQPGSSCYSGCPHFAIEKEILSASPDNGKTFEKFVFFHVKITCSGQPVIVNIEQPED